MRRLSRRGALLVLTGASAGIVLTLRGASRWMTREWRGFTEAERIALGALLEVLLPSSVSAASRARLVEQVEVWLVGYPDRGESFHMHAEYTWWQHGLYLPPSPREHYSQQLEALGERARETYGADLAALGRVERAELVKQALKEQPSAHVPEVPEGRLLVDLLCFYYRDPAVVDACFGRRIGRLTCRGLDGVGEPPQELG